MKLAALREYLAALLYRAWGCGYYPVNDIKLRSGRMVSGYRLHHAAELAAGKKARKDRARHGVGRPPLEKENIR